MTVKDMLELRRAIYKEGHAIGVAESEGSEVAKSIHEAWEAHRMAWERDRAEGEFSATLDELQAAFAKWQAGER
jgi:hypothetical protein